MRLLILKCSAAKRGGSAPIPAVDRYDGPLWRVLRSYLREQPAPPADLVIYGLSAEYGLIAGSYPIPYYDRTMDSVRADALRPQVLTCFGELMRTNYERVGLGLSRRYLRAMTGWERLVPEGVSVTYTDGTMGGKLGQLRAWLEGRVWISPAASRPERLEAQEHPRGKTVLAGVPLVLTHDQVIACARGALASDGVNARRFRDWYVLIDGQRVGAKWLASVLSGMPTSRFDAANARRALLVLGVDVERVVDRDGDR